MIKKSIVILLVFILFSLFAVPHEVRADNLGESALTGLAIAGLITTAVGIISILVSSTTEDSRSSNELEKNEIYAENGVMNSGNKQYSIMEYPTKAEPSESPYILNMQF